MYKIPTYDLSYVKIVSKYSQIFYKQMLDYYMDT